MRYVNNFITIILIIGLLFIIENFIFAQNIEKIKDSEKKNCPLYNLFNFIQSEGVNNFKETDTKIKVFKNKSIYGNINDLVQSECGDLFIATESGLSKFDGIKFYSYKKQYLESIYSLLYDYDKNDENDFEKIFLATRKGLLMFEIKKSYVSEPVIDYKFDKESILDYKFDKESILFKDSKGLIWGTKSDYSSFLFDYKVNSFSLININSSDFIENEKNELYSVSFINLSLYRYSSNKKEFISVLDGPKDIGFNKKCLTVDNKGKFIVGTNDFIGYIENNQRMKKKFLNSDIIKLKSQCNDLLIDKKGNLWAVYSKFIVRQLNNKFKYIKIKELPQIEYQCIFQDYDGNIWVGSNNGLIFYDNLAPKIEIVSPSSYEISSTTLKLHYIGKDGKFGSPSNKLIYRYKIGNSKWIKANEGKANINYLENNKKYRLRLRVTDENNNTGTKEITFITPDTIVPKLQIINKDVFNDPLNVNSIELFFKAEDNRTKNQDILFSYQLKNLEGINTEWSKYSTKSNAKYDFLTSSNYQFLLKAIDKAGNVSNVEKLSFTIDTIAPTVKITNEKDFDKPLNKDSIKILFKVEDNISENQEILFSYQLKKSEMSNIQWSEYTQVNSDTIKFDSLVVGDYYFLLKVKDKAGNESDEVKLPFTLINFIPINVKKPINNTVPLDIITNKNNINKIFSVFNCQYTIAFLIFLFVLIVFIVIFFFIKHKRKAIIISKRFNPYIAGSPITKAENIYGRKTIIHDIFNTIFGDTNCIYLNGERRIGKTTLLLYLEKEVDNIFFPTKTKTDTSFINDLKGIKAHAGITFFCNIQGIKAKEFFIYIMKKLVEKINNKYKQKPKILLKENSVNYDGFQFEEDILTIISFLRDKKKLTKGKDILIIMFIDEFDQIADYDDTTKEYLRSILNTYSDNIKVVAAGTKIDKDINYPTSPLYNLFIPIEVKAINIEDSKFLITKPVKNKYIFKNASIKYIINKSDRKPYYIQRICYEAILNMLDEGKCKISLKHAKKAYNNIIKDMNSSFREFWNDLDKKVQEIITMMNKKNNQILIDEEIEDKIEKNDFNRYYKVLKIEKKILKINSTLFKDWLRNY